MRLVSLIVASLPLFALAADPTLVIQTQGRVIDAGDKAVDGSEPLTFKLYSKSDGTSTDVVWSESYEVVLKDGFYAVGLGDTRNSKKELKASDVAGDRWLGVTFRSVEFLPRLQIGLVPRALDAANLGGKPAGDYALKTDIPSKAADSDKLGGVAAAEYAKVSDIPSKAKDSEKLGGVDAALYAKTADLPAKAKDSEKLGGFDAALFALKTDTAPNALQLAGADAALYARKTDTAPNALQLGGVDASQYVKLGSNGSGTFTFVGHTPQTATPPTCNSAAAGLVYFDDTTKSFRGCNGTAWSKLGAGDLPTVSVVDPAQGLPAGGLLITITGTGFRGPANVLIGGVAATEVTVTSANTITAKTPVSSTRGAKDVVVQISDGGSATKAGGFTYIPMGDSQAFPAPSCKAINDERAGLQSKAYWIDPDGGGVLPAKEIYCDMVTEGGGWTLMAQNRVDADPSGFAKDWATYRIGFGNVSTLTGPIGWIGNEYIYNIVKAGGVTFKAITNTRAYRYPNWSIGAESTDYQVSIPQSEWNGSNADSGFRYQHGRKFSTIDRDNDVYSGSCAVNEKSGWWYRDCWWVQWGDYQTSQTYWNEASTGTDNYTTIDLWLK